MKTIVIYHSADLDGYCSGAIGKLKYPDAELVGYDYGKPFNWEMIPLDDCQVIMLDVSMPMELMKKMRDLTHGRFLWIDHHISAINDYNATTATDGQQVCKSFLRSGVAACELAWEFFFPEEPMPEGVKLLGEYDSWRNADKERWDNLIIPFQYGCRLDFPTIDDVYRALRFKIFSEESHIADIMTAGQVVLKYQRQQSKIHCSSAFEMEFEGLSVVCLNNGLFNSQVFESVYDPAKHQAMVCFKWTGQFWRVSMYSEDPAIDCSVIAKKHGGGGHKGAAGFTIEARGVPFHGRKATYVK